MRKEKQIGLRVGIPAFFSLELEDVYKHSNGPHKGLSFPGFLGYLIGLGLEQYRNGSIQEPEPEEPPEEALNLFSMNPGSLPDMFKEFDMAMKRQSEPPRPRLVPRGGA